MRIRTLVALALAATCLAVAGPAATSVAYPTKICPTMSLSTTTPVVGETITVEGVDFIPDAHVRLELHTKVYVLADLTVSGSGTFSTHVTMPSGVSGSHAVVAIGGSAGGATCPDNPVQIVRLHNGSQGTDANGGGTDNNGGGTAFTGVDVLLLLLIAALLIVAGVMLTRGGKRRRLYPNELG
jgi:hypothetical protein